MFNYKDSEGNINAVKLVVHILVVVFVILPVAFDSWFTVPVGSVGIVLHLGALSRVSNAGFHFKVPYIESVEKMGVQTQKEQVETSAASKDLQEVTTAVAVNYNVNQEQVAVLYKEVGVDFKSVVIDPAVQESIKASTANYTAEELVTKRETVRGDVLSLIKDKLAPRHIVVTEISMTNFKFSKTFNDAIEAKVTAEQSALAAKNKLEQVKYEADQRVAQAKGEAEAIKIQAQAIESQGGTSYVQLQAIKQWDGHLPTQMIPGATVPFLNLKN